MSSREQNAEEEEFHSTDSECLPYMHVQGLFFSSFFERRERGEKKGEKMHIIMQRLNVQGSPTNMAGKSSRLRRCQGGSRPRATFRL